MMIMMMMMMTTTTIIIIIRFVERHVRSYRGTKGVNQAG